MYEINLICPNCGNYMFEINENGKFECTDCIWIGDITEMTTSVYDL